MFHVQNVEWKSYPRVSSLCEREAWLKQYLMGKFKEIGRDHHNTKKKTRKMQYNWKIHKLPFKCKLLRIYQLYSIRGDFLLNQEYSTFKLQCNWILRMNVIQKIKMMRQCPFVHFCERKANQWQQQHLNEMLNFSVLLKIIPAWKFLTAVSIFHLFCIFSYSLQLLLTSLFVTFSLGYSTTRRANFNKLPTDNVNVSESSQWFDSLSLSLSQSPIWR